MTLSFKSSYNFDLLSCFNILTGNEYQVYPNKDTYEHFYPLVKSETKKMIANMVELLGSENITFPPTLLLAQINGYKECSIQEAFSKKDEINYIVEMVKQTPYIPINYLNQMNSIINMYLNIIEDLEQNGFQNYWEQKIKPQAIKTCKEFQEFPINPLFFELIKQYKPQVPENIDIYFCPLHKPYGTRLNITCDGIIMQDNMSVEFTLVLIAHEIFHVPCDMTKISESFKIIADKSWVIKAFNNRGEFSPYSQIDYFIEENIVDALAAYVGYKLGYLTEPYKYFMNRNNSSHVISPKFFDYLLAHPKNTDEKFEDFFSIFVNTL